MKKIGDVRRISKEESFKLEERITLEEVSKTLRNARNNVAPGAWGSQFHFIRSFGA